MADTRVCTVGAGALGGYMSARIAEAGFAVTIVDRGPQLEAIRTSGLRVTDPGGPERTLEVPATDDISLIGPQDIVILGVKAHQIVNVAPLIPSLFHSETVVVTIQNGIPWWYFKGHGGRHREHRLETLDPIGTIEQHISADRVIGCVSYSAAACTAPGIIQLVDAGKYPVGELDGTVSARARALVDLFQASGLRSRLVDNIRSEIWLKALGSVSFNPISALTRSTLVDIATNPETRQLVTTMMEEAQRVARDLGVSPRRTIEERIDGAQRVGAHKTSMLRDVEKGEELEVDALVGSIGELGRLTGNPTPTIDAVYSLAKQLSAVITQ